jgi:hypothetical protein
MGQDDEGSTRARLASGSDAWRRGETGLRLGESDETTLKVRLREVVATAERVVVDDTEEEEEEEDEEEDKDDTEEEEGEARGGVEGSQ